MIRVNNTEFNETDIVKEMQYHNAETHTEAKNKACEALIIGELLKQRAQELSLLNSTANTMEQGTNEAFLETLLDAEVEMPTATEEDCRQYFDANPRKFMTTPLIEARHILLDAAPDDAQARSEANELANEIIKRLNENLSIFSELAILHSKCPSAKMGGQLGQLSKGQTVPEFERQLFNCEKGLAQSPIESRYGIHIVLLDHHEPGKPLPYEMVKTRIAEYLNEKVKRKAIAQYIHTLISEATIDGFDFSVSASPLMQ